MPEAISNARPDPACKNRPAHLLATAFASADSKAVHREVVLAGGGRPGAEAVARPWPTAGWSQRWCLKTEHWICWREQLDGGEAEAIRLALEPPPVVVLLDDMAARSVALALGLRVTGTLGLLLRRNNGITLTASTTDSNNFAPMAF